MLNNCITKFGRPLKEYFNYERVDRALKLLEEVEEKERQKREEEEKERQKREEYRKKAKEFHNNVPDSQYARIELLKPEYADDFTNCFQYLDELAQAFQRKSLPVIITLYKNENKEKYMEIMAKILWTNEYFDVPLYSDIDGIIKKSEIQHKKAQKEYEEKERRANSPEMMALFLGHHK